MSHPAVLEQDAARFDLSVEQIKELGVAAARAKDFAYCPYSQFRVGAALLAPSGKIITGVNVENASYPVGTCAERCAIGKAVSEGSTKFVALAVSTDIMPPASPCGMCRQFIREFCPLSMPVFMYGGTGEKGEQVGAYVLATLKDLLPMSFGPEHLAPRA